MVLRCLFLLLMIVTPVSAYAQNSDDVVTDQKVLPTPAEKSDFDKALDAVTNEPPPAPPVQKTGTDLANEYFMRCVAENKPNYTIEVQEYMCGCTAAKIGEILMPAEMQEMQNTTKAGEAARMKFLIEVYPSCMQDAIKEITLDYCKEEDYLKRVVKGKKKTCECIVDLTQDYFTKMAPGITQLALKNDPMTIDPMHFYLSAPVFLQQRYLFMKTCYNDHAKVP